LKNPADQILAAAIVGMGFSGIDYLKFPGVLSDLAETVQIREHQVGAFVGGGAPGETDGENFGVQLDASFFAHQFE
jgi:hypothetical protein